MSLDVLPVILASASPRRRDLLHSINIACTVQPTDIDEAGLEAQFTGAPEQVAIHLAEQKVRAAAAATATPAIIVAADTTVIIDNSSLGKPLDVPMATAMLRQLRGRTHAVITGVAVMVTTTPMATVTLRTQVTLVTMRDYTDAEIADYIATGDPFDKAGSYAMQDASFQPVARIDSCGANVIGLPLCLLIPQLRQQGIFAKQSNVGGVCRWNARCTRPPTT